MVVNIVATLTPAPSKSDRIAQLITELAEYCEKHEPNTLRYVCSKIVGTGTSGDQAVGEVKFTVIEQYTDHASFKTHTEAEWHGFVGKVLASEGLLAKPLDIMRVEKIAGFESR